MLETSAKIGVGTGMEGRERKSGKAILVHDPTAILFEPSKTLTTVLSQKPVFQIWATHPDRNLISFCVVTHSVNRDQGTLTGAV